MLTADMRERTSGRIELKNTRLNTGHDLLYYIYNRRLRDGSDLVRLLALADQYELQELKAGCVKQLTTTITKVRAWWTKVIYRAEL
jgi:hypothetical protein